MKRISDKSATIQKELLKNGLAHSALPHKTKFDISNNCSTLTCSTRKLMFDGLPFVQQRQFANFTGMVERFGAKKKFYQVGINGVGFENQNDLIGTIDDSYGKDRAFLGFSSKDPSRSITYGRLTHSAEEQIDLSTGKLKKPILLDTVDFKGKQVNQYALIFDKPLYIRNHNFALMIDITNFLNKPNVKAILDPVIDPILANIKIYFKN